MLHVAFRKLKINNLSDEFDEFLCRMNVNNVYGIVLNRREWYKIHTSFFPGQSLKCFELIRNFR